MFALLCHKHVTSFIEKRGDIPVFCIHIGEDGNFEAEFRSRQDFHNLLALELLLERWAKAKVKITHHGKEDSVFYCQTLQRHIGDCSASTVEMKCVCEGNSRVDYIGKIEVPENVTGIKVVQRNKNLVFSEDVCIHTEPMMNVHSKDVECIHGAATGGIDPGVLEYFAMRGIGMHEAKELIIAGFLA